MITLSTKAQRTFASIYFYENAELPEKINKPAADCIEHALQINCSRAIIELEDFYSGRKTSTILSDILSEVHSLNSAELKVFVIDNWYKAADLQESLLTEIDRDFLPAVVYSLGSAEDLMEYDLDEALRRCHSFAPILFCAFKNNDGFYDIVSVIISAFDRQGCISWRKCL